MADELVTVRSFLDGNEARATRDALEAEGIPAFLDGDGPSSPPVEAVRAEASDGIQEGPGGRRIRLRVGPGDVVTAAIVLDVLDRAEEARSEAIADRPAERRWPELEKAALVRLRGSDRLITVRHFFEVLEAQMMRNVIEAEGIPAFLEGAEVVSMNWGFGNAAGVRLQVPEVYVEHALRAMREAGGSAGEIGDDDWREGTEEEEDTANEELVTVAHGLSPSLADKALTLLDREGVACFRVAEEGRGAEVRVFGKDEADARKALEGLWAPPVEVPPTPLPPADEPDEPLNERERAASRAMTAALFGTVLLPLHLVAMWHLLKVTGGEESLRPAARRQAWTAGLLVLLLGVPLMLISLVGLGWLVRVVLGAP